MPLFFYSRTHHEKNSVREVGNASLLCFAYIYMSASFVSESAGISEVLKREGFKTQEVEEFRVFRRIAFQKAVRS